jgi:hemin uptake protein HemP
VIRPATVTDDTPIQRSGRFAPESAHLPAPDGAAGRSAVRPNVMEATSRVDHVSSDALFGGRREIIIVHRDQKYRLRITRMDKLILTK